jgi:hypothetical protein
MYNLEEQQIAASQSPGRCPAFSRSGCASFYAQASLVLLWLPALQLPQLSFAAKNLVSTHTASSHFSSGPALAYRAPWQFAA